MQFQYGNYFHQVNSVFFKSIRREFIRGESTQRIHLARTTWDMEGKQLGTFDSIQADLQTLQAAYAVDNQLAVMLDNNGNPTDWLVDPAQTVGGTRVTNPISHEMLDGAHGATYLKYNFGLTWDVLWSAPGDVLEFQESLSFNNNQGLPIQVLRRPVNFPPIIQNVTFASEFYATQSGEMWQSGPNPQPPSATFPGMFLGEMGSNQVTPLPTKAIRGVPYMFGVAWKYEFISVNGFFGGSPNYR